jgi:hypothetical protein
VIAAGADTERRRVVEACRAELDWARADFIRIAGATRLDLDLDAEGREGVPLWEATRLPHEQAAATALNAWGHLDPIEWRARLCWKKLHPQRRAGTADWTARARATAKDLRWQLAARKKPRAAFAAAVAEYRRLRATLDVGLSLHLLASSRSRRSLTGCDRITQGR